MAKHNVAPTCQSFERNQSISIETDPYFCKITIKKVGRIGDITVGHIPTELSRVVFYFILEGEPVNETVANITPRPSPIPEAGHEIPILMHSVHKNINIL